MPEKSLNPDRREVARNHQDFARRNPNQPYITHVAKPKLEKLHAAFPDMLKT